MGAHQARGFLAVSKVAALRKWRRTGRPKVENSQFGRRKSAETTGLRLLLVTFEMNPASHVLAWQFRVAEELSSHVERLVVFTHLKDPDAPVPCNVEILLFPLWLLKAPLRWVGGPWLANFYVWWLCFRNRLNVSYFHMNIEWCYRLAPALRLRQIPIAMWYAHGSVDKKLIRALDACDVALTSSELGLRVPSSKVRIIGQGVDTSSFSLIEGRDDQFEIICVGRISERKQIDRVLAVFEAVKDSPSNARIRLRIVGVPLTADDRMYERRVRMLAIQSRHADQIEFRGHIDLSKLSAEYEGAFVHLNLSNTGSMDKVVLESLSMGCPVVTSNVAFRWLGVTSPDAFVDDSNDASGIATQIAEYFERRTTVDRPALRSLVVGHHDLSSHTKRIVQELVALVGR